MLNFLASYWGWLAAIFAVGVLGGWTAHGDDESAPRWPYGVAGLLAIGGVADLLHLLGGPLACAVETAIPAFIAFALGALLTGGGRIRGFWWGPFIVAALIWLCSTYFAHPCAKKPVEAPAPAAQTAPTTLAEKKAAAIAAAKALPDSGPLAAAQCQTALAGLIASENVKFDTGSVTVADGSKALIGKIGGTLARCPDVKIEVGGYTDSTGDAAKNKALSQKRAEAVADVLKAGGATAERLTAVGYGADNPIASNDTDDGRAENRRIEFTVK